MQTTLKEDSCIVSSNQFPVYLAKYYVPRTRTRSKFECASAAALVITPLITRTLMSCVAHSESKALKNQAFSFQLFIKIGVLAFIFFHEKSISRALRHYMTSANGVLIFITFSKKNCRTLIQ